LCYHAFYQFLIIAFGGDMSLIPALDEPNVSGRFDTQENIFYVYYKNTLTADATNKAYAWLFKHGAVVGINIRAFVFDFTQVKLFQRENTRAAQNQSRRANATSDLSRIPAALVVQTHYQEQLVLLSMMANKVEERTRICHSHDEALQFIDDFHYKLKHQDAAQSGS
jgi:hypothetical protein